MATVLHRPAVELVALLASAGGLDAVSTVLRDLPTGLPAAIVVQQHLGDHDSALPAILRRQTARQVSWAHDGQALVPGEVVVCPPGMHLELTADHRCRLRDMKEPGERRFDVLLASIAGSYGPRSVGVVLSGSGRDGATGTAAMKRAGAIVIAESPDTAQYSSMPMAAAQAGADLVLPVHEIGPVVADIVAGVPLLTPPDPCAQCWSETDGAGTTAADGIFTGLGEATTARRDHPAGRWLSDARDSAAARAEVARVRAVELRRRRQDISAGFGATAQTVAAARRRAEESRRRAQLAHQAAEAAAARWGVEHPDMASPTASSPPP